MELKKWQELSGMTDSEIAKTLEVSRVQVFRYKFGHSMPRPRVMARIVEMTEGAVLYEDLFEVYRRQNKIGDSSAA